MRMAQCPKQGGAGCHRWPCQRRCSCLLLPACTQHATRLPHRLEGERRRHEEDLADALRVEIEHDFDEESDEGDVRVLEAADREGGHPLLFCGRSVRVRGQRRVHSSTVPHPKLLMSNITITVSVLYPSACATIHQQFHVLSPSRTLVGSSLFPQARHGAAG